MPVSRPPRIDINEPDPKYKGIAWHIENAFVRIFKRFFNAVRDTLLELIANALYRFVEIIEPGIKESTDNILRELLELPGLPDKVKSDIRNTLTSNRQASIFLRIGYSILGVMGYMTGPISVMGRASGYTVDNTMATGRPSPLEIWAMMRRNAIPASEGNQALKDLGFAEVYRKGFGELSRNLLEPSDLAQALHRGEIGQDYFEETLRKKGYSAGDVAVIRELIEVIPGPQDLIRMAVREAFNDNVARTFGYDEDYPPEFGEWAEKQGLSSDWARKYWRAHWELPGVNHGYEMLHRRIIDDSELELLLRSRDISPFWREKLVKMSYHPYTRVDARRMYEQGVLTEDEVYETYLDLGYSPDKAEKLTQWTVLEYAQKEIELTKADILGSYRDSTITEQETISYLEALGYEEGTIGLLLARIDLKKQQDYEKELIKNIRISFVGGVIQENDVYAQLAEINPPAGYIEERLKIWRVQKERGTRKPTITQLRDFYLTNVLSRQEVMQEMKNIGYPDKYVTYFLSYWELKAQK